MNETLEQQIKRLEFCRDCIDQSYKAGRDEYNRLERMIEELKEQLKSTDYVCSKRQRRGFVPFSNTTRKG